MIEPFVVRRSPFGVQRARLGDARRTTNLERAMSV